ncbi:MAG: hypothetical protein EBQ92_00090 [Proteobacteria bacterium]|nr:hypothetical protein [Pseudomonadota bacterium]
MLPQLHADQEPHAHFHADRAREIHQTIEIVPTAERNQKGIAFLHATRPALGIEIFPADLLNDFFQKKKLFSRGETHPALANTEGCDSVGHFFSVGYFQEGVSANIL